jgi:hypothetical protein
VFGSKRPKKLHKNKTRILPVHGIDKGGFL